MCVSLNSERTTNGNKFDWILIRFFGDLGSAVLCLLARSGNKMRGATELVAVYCSVCVCVFV